MASSAGVGVPASPAAGGLPITTGKTNPSLIPEALFIDSIEGYIKAHATSVESLLQELQTLHQKYRFMQENVVSNRAGVSEKIPAIEGTLQAIAKIAENAAMGADLALHYNLSDQVFAEARVPPTERVAVYLGAGVILEYPVAEAQAMLEKQLAGFKAKLASYTSDMEFLQDQINVAHVNISRTFNYDVVTRRRAKAEAAAAAAAATAGSGSGGTLPAGAAAATGAPSYAAAAAAASGTGAATGGGGVSESEG